MIIHLKSGKSFKCEEESYTESNQISGELIHIFISLDDRKKYMVHDEDIEFFESDLTDEDLKELASYSDTWYEDEVDCSFG